MHSFSDAELKSYMLANCGAYHAYHPRAQTFFVGVIVGLALAFLTWRMVRWFLTVRVAR